MQTLSMPFEALSRFAQTRPYDSFLVQPVGDDRITCYDFSRALDICRRIAGFLRRQPLRPGDRVGILSKNCAEWMLVDWAIQMAGLVSVPLFPTAAPASIEPCMASVDVAFLWVGKLDEPDRFLAALPKECPSAALPYPTIDCDYAWEEVLAGEPLPEREWASAAADDSMTILFTSGSTGKPKGVALSFGAYRYACSNSVTAMSVGHEDRLLSYLPLAHIAERMMIQGSAVYAGAQVFFVESLQTFARDLQRAQPTAFMAVPRLWKKFRTKIESRIPPVVLGTLLTIPGARQWVRKKVRRALGLQHARLIGSGAAPLDEALILWYQRLGIEISEAWGLTETCGLSCMNFPFDSGRIGTIGRPVPGTELKVSDTGELLIRSPGVFNSYFKDPAATAAAFDCEGFFRTGDRARWDDEREAWVVSGRMGDNFKTAKGKFVAPLPIESRLLSHGLVEHACVMGPGLAQPAAVIQLSEMAAGMPRDRIDRDLRRLMQQVNNALESHERLATMVIGYGAWNVESGLLTPTMKIRRRCIEERFLQSLAGIDQGTIHWLES